MFKMKALILLVILALAAACGEQKAPQTAAPVADNEENRLAAAKKYLEVSPPKEMLNDLASKVAPTLPEKNRKSFVDLVSSKDMQEATYRISLNGLVKHFTVNEINALTAFYGSPEGKSVRQKFGDYMADVMPQVVQEVAKAMKDMQEQQQPKASPEQKTPEAGKTPPAPKAQPGPASPKPGPPAAK